MRTLNQTILLSYPLLSARIARLNISKRVAPTQQGSTKNSITAPHLIALLRAPIRATATRARKTHSVSDGLIDLSHLHTGRMEAHRVQSLLVVRTINPPRKNCAERKLASVTRNQMTTNTLRHVQPLTAAPPHERSFGPAIQTLFGRIDPTIAASICRRTTASRRWSLPSTLVAKTLLARQQMTPAKDIRARPRRFDTTSRRNWPEMRPNPVIVPLPSR